MNGVTLHTTTERRHCGICGERAVIGAGEVGLAATTRIDWLCRGCFATRAEVLAEVLDEAVDAWGMEWPA